MEGAAVPDELDLSQRRNYKCQSCRLKRRARCITPRGETQCTRCAANGVPCIRPLARLGMLEEQGVRMTPGEYTKEIVRPTALHRTRLAVSQLLEDLGDLLSKGKRPPPQIVATARMVMSRARACNDVAILHAAVSMSAALHVENSMDPFAADPPVVIEPERVRRLVQEADEYLWRGVELDGIRREGVAFVRQETHNRTCTVACNDLFKQAFFDTAGRDIAAPFVDIGNAIVDDESKETLAELHEQFAQQLMFKVVPQTRSKMFIFSVTSKAPMALIGRTGERYMATMRVDSVWPADGSVAVVLVMLIGLRREELAPRAQVLL